MDVMGSARAFDRVQRRHSVLAFPVAVGKKFHDDEGGNLTSLIAYRAFFSLFPLLLLLATVLGYLLAGDPELRRSIIDSTLSQFPVIGDQLRNGTLKGNGLALVIGIVGSVVAGLGVVLETERAFDRVWGVPAEEQLGFVGSRLRAVTLLLALGGLAILSTVVTELVTGGSSPLGWVLGVAVAAALNFAVFSAVFRLLTTRSVGIHALITGIAIAAVGWELLQLLGGWYLSHQVRNATPVYGTFALVIGLFAWIHLAALFTILGAEANVVRERRLWPRSLMSGHPG